MKKRRRSLSAHGEPVCCGREFTAAATHSYDLVKRLAAETFKKGTKVPSSCRRLLDSAEDHFREGSWALASGDCTKATLQAFAGERELGAFFQCGGLGPHKRKHKKSRKGG